MQYRKMGKTDIELSILGFGGMRFNDNHSIEEAAKVPVRANELGINYFDTAPGYCGDRSFDIYKEAFPQMKNPFYTGSKIMPLSAPTADDGLRAVENALVRTGRDYIDLFYVWCLLELEHYELAMKKGGLYDGLMKAKDRGLIRSICASTHLEGDDLAHVVKDDAFDAVLLGYNILNHPYREIGIDTATKTNKGVIIMNPLGGGLIPMCGDRFDLLKDETSPTTASVGLRFVLGNPNVTCTLSGMQSIEEVEQNVALANNIDAKKGDVEFIGKAKTLISGGVDGLCTGCGYCLSCPKDIYIPGYMLFYNKHQLDNSASNEARATGLNGVKEWGELRNGGNATAADCIRCGKCEKLCTQHLPIEDRLEFIARNWETPIV